MIRFAFFTAALAILTGTPALADVVCVQRELTRLGFDPGPADGALGARTLRAAADFQKGTPYFNDLAEDTAVEWCNTLRTAPMPNPQAAVAMGIGEPMANGGAISGNAMDATPVLGETPEYQVPKWVGP